MPKEKTKSEENEENAATWGAGHIAIQGEPVVINNETQEQYSIQAALALILNKIDTIEKNVVG